MFVRFVLRYGGEEVTPYIHVFVYHVGFFLEKFGCLERFANYATETWHSRDKKVMKGATSGFGHSGKSAAQNICYQQLTHGFREEYYRVQEKERGESEGPIRQKRRRYQDPQARRRWSSRNFPLSTDPRTATFVDGTSLVQQQQEDCKETENVSEAGVK